MQDILTCAMGLDLSPFVSYMLDVFEQCMIDAALSRNDLTTNEPALLE